MPRLLASFQFAAQRQAQSQQRAYANRGGARWWLDQQHARPDEHADAIGPDARMILGPEGKSTGLVEASHKAGLAVQGDGGDIILDASRGQATVGEDGTISQEGQAVGRLTLARFDALGVLSKDGDGLYRNRSNATPIDAAGVQVRQGMLEGSNVNALIEITNLIEISRAYERAAKMIEQTTELSRRSVERLGRAS